MTGNSLAVYIQWEKRNCLYLQAKAFFSKQFQTGVDNGLIVERASVLFDFVQGLGYSEGRPIGPVGSHGLHDVGNSDNLGLLEDLITGKTPRIAGAVHPFVMLQDDLSDRVLIFDILQYFVSGFGMVS